MLRNPGWNQMLEDLAEEAGGLVDDLEHAPEGRLCAVAEHVRRIANGGRAARDAIGLADRALFSDG